MHTKAIYYYISSIWSEEFFRAPNTSLEQIFNLLMQVHYEIASWMASKDQ